MERLLNGVHDAAAGDAFDRRHLGAVGLGGQHRAGFDALPVEEHRTRAALARVTPDVRSR